jgi:hypothetical protein
MLFFFSSAFQVEKLHPLQAGVYRMRHRRDRRPGLPIEPVWSFYPKRLWEIVSKHVRFAPDYAQIYLMAKRAKREQKVRPYTDVALSPVQDEEIEALELFTHNEGARNEVARTRKIAALTHAARVEPAK